MIGSGYIAAIIPSEVITGSRPEQRLVGRTGRRHCRRRDAGRTGGRDFRSAPSLKSGGGAPQVIAYVVAWALFAFQRLILGNTLHAGAVCLVPAAVSLPFPFLAAAIAMAIGRP